MSEKITPHIFIDSNNKPLTVHNRARTQLPDAGPIHPNFRNVLIIPVKI